MADGYYRATGRVGAAMVVPGPGALNAGAGLATAYGSNSKVLFIAGQIHSTALHRGYGLLHEIKDQTGFVRGLTKWNHLIESPADIAPSIDQAFRELSSGRPRPVGIEIPHDYLSASARRSVDSPQSVAVEPSAPDSRALQKVAAIINEARLPVLYVGGGIVAANAGAALQTLAERIGAPVVMSDNGRGAMDDRHPLAMNTLAGRAVFEHADVVVVIGSRFVDSVTPRPAWPYGQARFVHINIDGADMGAPRAPEAVIVADARVAIEALTDMLSPRVALPARDAERVKEWARRQFDTVSPQAEYIDEMRSALPEDGIFVNELTQVGYLARSAFPIYGPRTYIGPGYQGTLGYGFPAALGAAVGSGKRVLAVTGDGGFGWNLQELSTAKRYQLPVTLVVFNDGHFGNVRAIQKRQFGAEVAVELENPDFCLLGSAFGVDTVRVDTPAALGGAIRDSVSASGPVMIEVQVGVMPSPWHLLRLQAMIGATGPTPPPNPLGVAG
jgi:acetolactate synthase-1/2/3 large subunit